jgi:hypothetical protein
MKINLLKQTDSLAYFGVIDKTRKTSIPPVVVSPNCSGLFQLFDDLIQEFPLGGTVTRHALDGAASFGY